LKRALDTGTAEARRGFEAGKQELFHHLLKTLESIGLRAMASQCDQILRGVQEEKNKILAARSHLAQQSREAAPQGNSPQHMVEKLNRRYQASLEEQFLAQVQLDYQRLIDWFGVCLGNARGLIGQLERLHRQHENLLEAETAKAEASRQHRVLDTQYIIGLLADQEQALLDKAIRLIEDALERGELDEGQLRGLQEKAITLSAEGLKPYQSLRAALALAGEGEQQRIFNQVFRAAQPSLRIRDDYVDFEEHVLVTLSESDTDLLDVIRSFAPQVICSQGWREDAVVIMRVWHGIEPSAMPSVHEARAAYARQTELLVQGSNGAPKEVFPFIDRRFRPPCLVVPSGVRREALLLIPLSSQVDGPIQYDAGRCGYVYRNGQQPIDLGPTRKQAFDNLIREENRHPDLPCLEKLLEWNKQKFEALGAENTIEILRRMIDTQEGYLCDPDLAMDRLILEEEHRALQMSWRERGTGLRRKLALAKANGNHPWSHDKSESMAS
jgi:hypothetical protein